MIKAFYEDVNEIYTKYYSDIDRVIFDKLYNVGKNYFQWLIRMYKKNNYLINDLDEIKATLKTYDKAKYRLPLEQRNIDNFKSYEELDNVINLYSDINQIEELSDKVKKLIVKNETTFVYEEKDWLVVIPRTWRSSQFWGSGTVWCTRRLDSDSYYKSHTGGENAGGVLFIVINRSKKEKWQFHEKTGQYRDRSNTQINIEKWINEWKPPKELINLLIRKGLKQLSTDEVEKEFSKSGIKKFERDSKNRIVVSQEINDDIFYKLTEKIFRLNGNLKLMNKGINELHSNFPLVVEGNIFIISNPNLASLDNFPKAVLGNVTLSMNGLTSLKGLPEKELEGSLSLFKNNISDVNELNFLPKIIHGDLNLSGNPISSQLSKEIISKYCKVLGRITV